MTGSRSPSLLLLSTAAFLGALAVPAAASAQTATPSQGLPLPDRSISAQDDAASVEVNPAGLGFMQNAELQYNFQLATPDLARTVPDGHAVFAAAGAGGLGLGFGAQFLYSPELRADQGVSGDYRKYTLAGALGDGQIFSLGFGYNFFGSEASRALDDLRTWDVGAQLRLNQYLGLGLFARDINTPFFLGDRTLPTRWGTGLVLRLWEGRIQLDGQATYLHDSGFVGLTPRVVLEFLDGLRLFGRADFQVTTGEADIEQGLTGGIAGLELSMGSFGAQAALVGQRAGGEGELSGHTYTVWAASNKKRALVDLRDRWILIDLSSQLSDLPSGGLFGPSAESFVELLVELDQIAADPTIAGVVFNVAGPGIGYGQIWELRQRVEALEAAGKKTVAFMQTADTKTVMVASATETVWMLPNIVYEPIGVAAQLINYKTALAKLGVEAEFLRVRDYKSAPEAYVRDAPSPESLEQTGAYVEHIYEALVSSIAQGRDKPPEAVRGVIDQVPLLPDEASERGFIDGVIYSDQIEEQLRKKFGKRVSLQRGYTPAPTSEERWRRRPAVAVLVISGAITQGNSGRSPLGNTALSGSDTIIGALERLRKNPTIRAVVLRIDSPGGSALASDQIYRELRRLAQKKPLVASMGNIAASGGYYVAAGADEIWATPLTLTGSIGIFAGKVSLSRLGDRIGIHTTTLRRGERAGLYSLLTPFTPEQRAYISKYLIYLYELFLEQVAHTRPLSVAEVDALARGRIWSGEAAKQNKLVDRSGGLLDAIRRAEELAGLPPREATYPVYPRASGVLSSLGEAQAQRLASLEAALRPDPPAQVDTLMRLAAPLERMLEQISQAALMPLLFEDGEPLMLPPVAIELR